MFLPSNSTSKYMDGYEVHHRVTPVHNLWMFLVTRTQQNDHRGGFNPDSAIQMFLVQFVRPISQSLLTDAPSNFCPIETAPEMFEFPVRPTVHTNSSRTRNALQTGGI